MSLIYNRVSDQRIRDHIDTLPDAEHTLEKYLHLDETQELSEANAAAFNPQPSTASVHELGYKGQGQGKRSGKPCSSCGYKHKYGECKAKGEKCKKCGKEGHFAKVCRSKSVNNSQYRSNNKSARLSGKRKVHILADDGEVLETMHTENTPWIDSIHVQSENTTTYSAKGYSKVDNIHTTRSHQSFTRIQMFPMNKMGKATDNKPKGMKYKLDTGAGVNIMPLSIYQYINPSEFDEQGRPIDGHGQYKTILKDYNGNPTQQYGTRVILGKWNHQYWRFVFHIVEAEVLCKVVWGQVSFMPCHILKYVVSIICICFVSFVICYISSFILLLHLGGLYILCFMYIFYFPFSHIYYYYLICSAIYFILPHTTTTHLWIP